MSADTLINYVPINVAICEEGEVGGATDLERRVGEYVQELIRLNEEE